jgi:hypothetical protein
MTEWKIGDRAMVEIKSDGRGWVKLCCSGNPQQYTLVPTEVLHPLPSPDPLTDLERAVVDAAMAWCEGPHGWYNGVNREKFISATKTLAATLTPPDPVKEMCEAWLAMASQYVSTPETKRMTAAVQKVMQREKGKCP